MHTLFALPTVSCYLLLEVVVALAIAAPTLAYFANGQQASVTKRLAALHLLEQGNGQREAWLEAVVQAATGKRSGSIEIDGQVYSWQIVEETLGQEKDCLCALICIELKEPNHTWREWSIAALKSVSSSGTEFFDALDT